MTNAKREFPTFLRRMIMLTFIFVSLSVIGHAEATVSARLSSQLTEHSVDKESIILGQTVKVRAAMRK